LLSAYFSRLLRGSAPGESTKINGTVALESLKTRPRSNWGGVMKYSPIYDVTQRAIAGISISGLKHLMKHKNSNLLIFFHLSLNSKSYGEVLSYIPL